MTTTAPACQACGAINDAYLCRRCTEQIEQVIGDLPALRADLAGVIRKEARVYRAATTTRPVERHDAEAHIPAMLRSRHGAIALPATPLPINLDAAELAVRLDDTIRTWTEHLRARVPNGPACHRCRHEVCALIRDTAATHPHLLLVRLAPEIRYDTAAGAAHAHILSLHRQIELQVSGQTPAAYAGKCDRPDVTIERPSYVGPPCSGLTCAHTSCEDARTHHARIAPVPATCNADLYAADGQTTITCEACGATYDVVQRHRELAAKMDDEWRRPSEIARALTSLDYPIKELTLLKWIERDRKYAARGHDLGRQLILQRGIDDDGNALYRVGDVRARVATVREEAQRLAAG